MTTMNEEQRREQNLEARSKDMTPKEVAEQIVIEERNERSALANMSISEDTRRVHAKSAIRRREFWEEVERRQSPV